MSIPSEQRVAVVIEDDDDIRHLLETVLSQAGFRVVATSNGVDGVDAVRNNNPVVTTLDVNMPGMDGFEVARRIRAFSQTYIVMLTALNEEIDTLQGLEAGADDYINKPFRPRELRARIEAMLRRPRVPIDDAPAAAAPQPPYGQPQQPYGAPQGSPYGAPQEQPAQPQAPQFPAQPSYSPPPVAAPPAYPQQPYAQPAPPAAYPAQPAEPQPAPPAAYPEQQPYTPPAPPPAAYPQQPQQQPYAPPVPAPSEPASQPQQQPYQPPAPPSPYPVPGAPTAVAPRTTPTGAAHTGSGWLEHNGLWLNMETRVIQQGQSELDLTRSEFDLLAALLESGRRVRTKADLVLLLRGESYVTSHFISEADKRAIEVHMGNLRKKLGDNIGNPRWIETVRGVGYRLTAPEE